MTLTLIVTNTITYKYPLNLHLAWILTENKHAELSLKLCVFDTLLRIIHFFLVYLENTYKKTVFYSEITTFLGTP